MRRAGAPLRSFFNQHFEAVKDETRRTADQHTDELTDRLARYDAANAGRVAALTVRVDDLDRRLDELADLVVELRTSNDRLVAVIAAMTERADGPPSGP